MIKQIFSKNYGLQLRLSRCFAGECLNIRTPLYDPLKGGALDGNLH
jgi:hypothetical protein